MKTAKTIFNKAIIVTVTLFFLGLAFIGNGSAHAETETTGIADGSYVCACGVSDAEVVKYLNSYGYEVVAMKMVDGCCDRVAVTQFEYSTRIYVRDSRIIGHEDESGM